MADQQDRQIGTILGEYRLLRRLGVGTCGTVYLATHIDTDSPAAVKILKVNLERSGGLEMFRNEAWMILLRHPHIVQMLDFGMNKENLYLVMEYAAGGTLRQRYPRGTRLPLRTMLTYIEQLAGALSYAHKQRVIHRDLKPENLLLRADGTLLLSDFGIAKVLEASVVDGLPAFVGTPAYMAPEQSAGNPCFASDQYALAVLVYEWMTGHLPFRGSHQEVIAQHRQEKPPALTRLVPNLPLVIERVVLKALEKEPERRFASVQAFAATLKQAFQGKF